MSASMNTVIGAAKRRGVWENRIAWGLQIVAAVIFVQTLYFKFSGAKESVYIFSALGVEPWGRILSGVMELIAAILLVLPRVNWMGAAIGLGVIGGAILSHAFVIGIVVQDDGGLLFSLAVTTAISCAAVAWLRRGVWLPYLEKA